MPSVDFFRVSLIYVRVHRFAGRAENGGRFGLRQGASGRVDDAGPPGGGGRGPRHVRAPGTAPRGRRIRARTDDRVDDGRPDGQDARTTQATVRARPVVPVPRGRN